jgi:hypothetical protein
VGGNLFTFFPFVEMFPSFVQIVLSQVSRKQALQWCEQHNKCQFYETSAKDAIRVDEAFKTAATLALQRRPEEPAMPYATMIFSFFSSN